MPELRPIETTSAAASAGPITAAILIDMFCSATALGSSRCGTSSTTHAWRAGPISENVPPIRNVEPNSSGIVMLSLTIRMPVTTMIAQGMIWLPSTNGFFV